MQLLTILTLIYVAVLVLALAVSLILILVYLMRIARSLREVQSVLERVRDETGPLNPHLEGLHQVVSDTTEGVRRARTELASADKHLGLIAGQYEEADIAR